MPRLVCCLLLLALGTRAELPTVPHLPTDRWQVEAAEGDLVKLSAQGETLVLDYDVNVAAWHQVGHQSLKQASIKLLLTTPVTLGPEAARVVFEAWGHMKGTWQTQDAATQFRPLLQDAAGEWLSYTAYPYPHLKNGATTWGCWMSNAFYAAEAGGATQDVFEALGGDGNAWPDGELRFVGFELTVRKREFGRAKGRLALGEITIAPTRLPFAPPFAYADSLLPKPGAYRLAMAISTGYQQPPLIERETAVTLAPESFDSARQKVVFPLPGDGEYWITWQLTGDGKVVGGDTMRHRVVDHPVNKLMAPADPAQPPALGRLRVNWAQHVGGVYRQDEPLAVQVRVFPRGEPTLTLAWELRQARYDAVLERGELPVTLAAGAPFADLLVTPQGEPGRDAYRLALTLKAGDTTVDATTYELGRQTDFSRPRTRPGVLLDRDYVKRGAYFRLTYIVTEKTRFASEDAAAADWATQLDEMTRLTRYITYMIDLRDCEVLPGVFDFALLDRVMDLAAERGAAVTVRFGHVDQSGLYTWPSYYRQENYDGTPIYMHYYGGFSVVDETYTSLWHRAYRALHDRYREHPGFQGYYLIEPAGESTIADKPWEGVVSGYEPPMRTAFVAWLQQHEQRTLAQVNQRWGTQYASWAELALPLPDFRRGVTPDLRLQWLDFCRFKDWVDGEGWYPVAAKAIRAYDPNHVIIIYGPPTTASELIDYGHNGGNHFFQREGQFVNAWQQHKVGWITEPHHPHRWAAYGDPSERGWVLDTSVYIMLAQAGGGGANLHVYYDPRPGRLPAHFGGAFAFDRMQKFRPICDELQTMTLVEQPFRVAVLQDPYTLFCKHRTVFWPRAEDLKRWFELLKQDSVRYEELAPAHLADYRLILPNLLDEVMSDANLRRLDQAVREHGAKLIIAANTGSYCPERGAERFQLLRQLGIPAPTGAYVQNRPNVTAKVVAENPLLRQGTELAFFSLADLQRDLQSPEIRDKFWAYPYRWIPQTDYFGYYPGHQPGGTVWASFAEGGAAVSVHQVGKGEVVVFWGLPDYRLERLPGFMARAAAWAGVTDPAQGAPIPRMLEGSSKELGRHYVILYHETPGTYRQPFPNTPDGAWFVDELVSDRRLGTWTGAELRAGELPLTFDASQSPLQILRLIPAGQIQTKWLPQYRTPPTPKAP